MIITTKNILGMDIDEVTHKSCIATIGTDIGWATVYSIESGERKKGHATELLTEAKKYYESQNKVFGSSIALNSQMRKLLKKLNIIEYK